MKIICWLKTIWYTISGGFPFYVIEGHDYVEVSNNRKKQVLRCEKCGHEDIGYY